MRLQTFMICSFLFSVYISVAYGYDRKVFCYYESFAHRRQGIGNFLPENINPWLCTHLIYAFVDISPDGSDLKPIYTGDVTKGGLYNRVVSLKKINPELKVLLAVGGWKMGSKPFMPIIESLQNMQTWVGNVVKYLRKYGFDGLDMDWEFPGVRGSTPRDKRKFTLLMKLLYEAFENEAAKTGKDKLILTLATAAGSYFINKAYEPRQVIKYVDYILLMSYNYHGGTWERITGHHSGLYKHKNDPPGEKGQTHQQWSINYWLQKGVPKHRLIVGIPTYGMSFTLKDPNRNGVFAPSKGPGEGGEFTKEKGIMSFYEICDRIQNRGWKTRWIESQLVPYTYSGDQWIGYENIDSAAIKARNIVDRGLGGAFVWSVTLDDSKGVCGKGKYPILTTVSRVLRNAYNKKIVTKVLPTKKAWNKFTYPKKKFTNKPWTTKNWKTWSNDWWPNTDEEDLVECNKRGLGIHKDPKSCSHFLLCFYVSAESVMGRRMRCANGTLFDDNLHICNHKSKVMC